jgi:chromosomal replication initiator protein
MGNHTRKADVIWQTAYGDLQLQLPRETFDTWLRRARLVAHEDGTYIIGVDNIYTREWLEHRLKSVVVSTLGRIAGRGVEVRFVLLPSQEKSADLRGAGPLLADLEPEEEEAPQFERLPAGETGLNPHYTFAAFVEGACNRLASAGARTAADAPGGQFNPLFIHASTGLGKTHLLHAIGNACHEQGRRVLYASAERFTNDLVGAIRARQTDSFREKYRGVDVLLVDDAQFIAGKDASQEEFYHTFNALHNAEAQIVLAASRPPAQIAKLDPHLRSRFEGGLVVDIQPPDFLTRLAILQSKAERRGFAGRIPYATLERIAETVEGSVRTLEGALNQVIARLLLSPEPFTAEMAEVAFDFPEPAQPLVTMADVIMAVADYYDVSPDDLCGRDRSREVSIARQVAMYVARDEVGVPLQQIGEALGGRSHSTVLYSCERIGDLLDANSPLRRQVEAIRQALYAPDSPVDQPHRERGDRRG